MDRVEHIDWTATVCTRSSSMDHPADSRSFSGVRRAICVRRCGYHDRLGGREALQAASIFQWQGRQATVSTPTEADFPLHLLASLTVPGSCCTLQHECLVTMPIVLRLCTIIITSFDFSSVNSVEHIQYGVPNCCLSESFRSCPGGRPAAAAIPALLSRQAVSDGARYSTSRPELKSDLISGRISIERSRSHSLSITFVVCPPEPAKQ
jgi:hypothetical protein